MLQSACQARYLDAKLLQLLVAPALADSVSLDFPRPFREVDGQTSTIHSVLLANCPRRANCTLVRPIPRIRDGSRPEYFSGGVLRALRDVRSLQLGIAAARLLDAVGDQLAVERRGVDAQHLAGLFLLPARRVQHLEDVLALQLLERERRRFDDQAAALARTQPDLLRQVL